MGPRQPSRLQCCRRARMKVNLMAPAAVADVSTRHDRSRSGGKLVAARRSGDVRDRRGPRASSCPRWKTGTTPRDEWPARRHPGVAYEYRHRRARACCRSTFPIWRWSATPSSVIVPRKCPRVGGARDRFINDASRASTATCGSTSAGHYEGPMTPTCRRRDPRAVPPRSARRISI
jgi:hypothetical protein